MARGVVLPILTEFKPQGIDKAIREFEKLETRTQKVGFALNKAFVPAVAVTGALAAGFVSLSLAGERAATANARIAQIAESMGLFGGEVQAVTDRLVDLAELTARQTGLDQNAIKETQAKLLTFKELAATAGEVGGQFDRATQAAIDLAAAGFGEATTNAVQLGKALNDPIKGITALTRSGVTFTAAEKDKIATLVESNKVSEAQIMILEAIETQVGGTAIATSDASARMSVAFSQLQERIGLALLPAFEKLTEIGISFFDFIGDNQTVVLAVAGAIGSMAAAIVAANVAMKIYAGLQTVVKVANAVMGTSFELTGAKMATFAKGLGIVGAAVGVAIFLYQDYQKQKRRVADLTAELIPLLDKEGEGFDSVAEKQLTALIASNEHQKAIEALGFTTQDYLKFIKGDMVPGMDVLTAAFEKGTNGFEVFQDRFGDDKAIKDNITNILNFNVRLNEMRIALGDASEEAARQQAITDELSRSHVHLANEFRITDDTAKAMSSSMAAAESAMQRYEDSVRAADDAMNKMIDTSLAMFNADLQLLNQIDRTTDTVEAYTAAMQSGTVQGRELERMQRDVVTEALRQADAAVAAAAAQAELAGKSLDASERQKILVDNLSAVARSLAPGDPLRRELASYIEQLGAVPRDVVTRFTTIRQEIIQQSIVEAQQFSPPAIAAASARAPRVTRQVGGPIPGPTGLGVPVLAHGGEYVLSADVVDAIKRGAPSIGLGRGRGAGGAAIVVNVAGSVVSERDLVETVRRGLLQTQRNGRQLVLT